ncbi:GNAT family N-acetyltransferase [Paenibacillus sp. BR2-3]|uniref:GNAT family N-acetyltransferase n=1 Tax=Paenibacillus sp. BR2-3 TaxID=3048494 RepID=UPI00397728F8
MFERYSAGDGVLQNGSFIKDEVQYNLIHRISEIEHSIKIRSADGNLIFTRSEGHNPWLWVSSEIAPEKRKVLVQELVEQVKEDDYPGITAELDTAKLFAESFCEAKGALFHTHMMLESYHCPKVHKPEAVGGHLRQANLEHSAMIAEFMAGFSEDAFGVPAEPEVFRSTAKEAVRSGNLYLWVVDDTPVSMANIAHRTARHGRINDVYTHPAHRKQGYASAVVAELCEQLFEERLTPMLYADAKNPDSNKVYQSIGFVEAGSIAELKFI